MAIYVAAPANIVSGGPESLHQFVHKANELGYDASICYYGPESEGATVPAAYQHYNTPVARNLPDNSRALIVVGEVMAPAYENFDLAQCVVWWLSVDNFHASAAGAPARYGRGGWDRVFEPRPRLTHVAHSEYARLYLEGHGVNATMLGDYLSPELLSASAHTADEPRTLRVLYNPRKGYEFTQALIEASAGRFEWVPIQGLDPAGVGKLLATSALYVDFGEHPAIAASLGKWS